MTPQEKVDDFISVLAWIMQPGNKAGFSDRSRYEAACLVLALTDGADAAKLALVQRWRELHPEAPAGSAKLLKALGYVTHVVAGENLIGRSLTGQVIVSGASDIPPAELAQWLSAQVVPRLTRGAKLEFKQD